MAQVAHIELPQDSWNSLLYEAGCLPDWRFIPLHNFVTITIDDQEVTVKADSDSSDVSACCTYDTNYFNSLSMEEGSIIHARLGLERIADHLDALGFPSVFEFRAEDSHEADVLRMISEDGSETQLELDQPNTGNNPCEPFQNGSVVFDGKPTKTKIETTTDELQQHLIDAFHKVRSVRMFPLLVRNGKLISEHRLGLRDGDRPTDQHYFQFELDADVVGVDLLNFYGMELRQLILSISGPLELHTSPYRRDPIDETERLAVIQRGEDRTARYILEPNEPKAIDDWTV